MFGMIDRRCRSRPARIAVISQGGGSKGEHKARYARSATSFALAPGARAGQTGTTAGLNFLSFYGNNLDEYQETC